MSAIIATIAPGIHVFRPYEGAPEAIWVEYKCKSTKERVQELYRIYKQGQCDRAYSSLDI